MSEIFLRKKLLNEFASDEKNFREKDFSEKLKAIHSAPRVGHSESVPRAQ